MSKVVEIVELRQKITYLNGKISGMYDLLDMSKNWVSEEEHYGLYMEAQSLEGFYAIEIEKLRQGE